MYFHVNRQEKLAKAHVVVIAFRQWPRWILGPCAEFQGDPNQALRILIRICKLQ